MKRMTLVREDIRNPLHPNLWQELCEQFEFEQDEHGDWPSELVIHVRSVEASYGD